MAMIDVSSYVYNFMDATEKWCKKEKKIAFKAETHLQIYSTSLYLSCFRKCYANFTDILRMFYQRYQRHHFTYFCV